MTFLTPLRLRSGSIAGLIALASGPLTALTLPVGAVQPPPPVSRGGIHQPPSQPSSPATVRPVEAPVSGAASAAGKPAPPAMGQATTTAAATSESVNRQILLELGKRTISLLEAGQVVKSWPVAIGDPSTPTPTGTFKVENKVLNPQYQSTKSGKLNPTIGAQGPLGDRWIGFKMSGANQYGIHGTPSAWAWTVTSRAAVSNGCVRMLTPHVRELFEKVDVGTPVVVRH
jgi:lipoprotein-anchoring transpeptidase ErfK/SrfK